MSSAAPGSMDPVTTQLRPQTDGAENGPPSGASSGTSSQESSGSSTPSEAEDLSTLVDGANDVSTSASPRAFLSGASSPGPVTGGSAISSRAGSPFRYPYQQSRHGSFFNDAGTPTAIRG